MFLGFFVFFSHLKTVGKKRSNTRKRKLDENILQKKRKKKEDSLEDVENLASLHLSHCTI